MRGNKDQRPIVPTRSILHRVANCRTGNTALGTPLITSCGLFHQDRAPTREASTASSLREDDIDDGGGEHRVMLERHTSAAKDGVIEMLTAKASKLGVSLERAMVAKKEAEDRVGRLQVRSGQYDHC